MQRQANELRFIVGRLWGMAILADELNMGYSVHTVVPADTSQTVGIKIVNEHAMDSRFCIGDAYKIVNDALHRT